MIQTLADGAQDEDARLEAIATAADHAQEDLAKARAVTQQVLNASNSIPFSENAQSRAKAEHGATITLQARVASFTGHALLSDEDAEVFTNARNWFDEAHSYVRVGNSAYYAASNAINAALLERSLGNNKEARIWSAEAAVSALVPFGLRDFITASSTLLSRGLRLPTRQRARSFILTHP